MDDVAWLTANTHLWSVEVNEHRACYHALGDYLATADNGHEPYDDAWVSPEDRALCLEADRLVELRVYPDTPVGFYTVYGHDPAAVIRRAREVVEAERAARPIDPSGELA